MAVINDDATLGETADCFTISSNFHIEPSVEFNPAKYTICNDFADEMIKKINERSKDMMGLYEVFVVDKKKGLVVGDTIIAKDERIAERKIVFPGDWNLDDLVFFTRCIGQWKSEKPQKVKIVKE